MSSKPSRRQRRRNKSRTNNQQQTQQTSNDQLKVFFYGDKELVKDFDIFCRLKGVRRKDGILKLMAKIVEKNKVQIDHFKSLQNNMDNKEETKNENQ